MPTEARHRSVFRGWLLELKNVVKLENGASTQCKYVNASSTVNDAVVALNAVQMNADARRAQQSNGTAVFFDNELLRYQGSFVLATSHTGDRWVCMFMRPMALTSSRYGTLSG